MHHIHVLSWLSCKHASSLSQPFGFQFRYMQPEGLPLESWLNCLLDESLPPARSFEAFRPANSRSGRTVCVSPTKENTNNNEKTNKTVFRAFGTLDVQPNSLRSRDVPWTQLQLNFAPAKTTAGQSDRDPGLGSRLKVFLLRFTKYSWTNSWHHWRWMNSLCWLMNHPTGAK